MIRVKFVLVVMLLGVSGTYARVWSQDSRMNVKAENVDLVEFFGILQQKTDLQFVFNHKNVQSYTVRVDVEDKTLSEVLDIALKGKPLKYEITDTHVIISNSEVVVTGRQAPSARITVSGTVVDTDNKPLAGVSVVVKGTNTGIATDVNGRFTLSFARGAGNALVLTMVGKETMEVTIDNRRQFEITMRESATNIQEVVALGYFEQDKRKLTSDITTLKMDDIMQPGTATLDQMLEGRVPGLIYMQNSGQVGATPKLKIRGTTTLLGSTAPLWVLDGVILEDPVNVDPSQINDLDFVNLLGNAISGLNPNDIEQIDVLKDASATAIYGPRASNGVIVITTKKGRTGAPSISYSLTGTFRQRPRYTDKSVNVMNSMERIDYSREAIQQGWRIPSLPAWVGYEAAYSDFLDNTITYDEFVARVSQMEMANTDWLSLLLQDTYSHNHSLSVSGGTDHINYYTSLGYMDERGNAKGEQNKRYTALVNLNMKYAKWEIRFGLNGNMQKRKYTPSAVNLANYAYNTARTIPAYTDEGDYMFYSRNPGDQHRSGFNILHEMENSSNRINTDQLGMQLGLRYNITPWLKTDLTFAYNVSHTNDETWYGVDSYYVLRQRMIVVNDGPTYKAGEQNTAKAVNINGGEIKLNNTQNENYNLRGMVTFNKALNDEQFLTAHLIGEMRESKYTGYGRTLRNYHKDRGMMIDTWDVEKYPEFTQWASTPDAQGKFADNLTRQLATILSASWSYRNSYILNGNMRMDWSNKFGDRSRDKFLPIWSVSGRWNMHENILSGVKWVNTLALKMSFGYQGNMSNSESPRLVMRYGLADPDFGTQYSEIQNFPNPFLKWEKTSNINASIEFSLFGDRLVGNLGYWYRHTSNAFKKETVSMFTGRREYTVNSGTLINQGPDLTFRFTPINNMLNRATSSLSADGERRGFRWRMEPNFGAVFNQLYDKVKPKDKILQDDEDITWMDYLNGNVYISGRPVNSFYSFRFKGLNHETGAPEFYGTEYQFQKTDANGNPMFNEKGDPIMVDWVDVYTTMSKRDVWERFLVRSGPREPFLQGSISNSFEYNNFALSFNLAYSIGAKIRLFKMYASGGSLPSPDKNMRREWADRWRVPGDEKHTNIPGIVGGDTYANMSKPWFSSSFSYHWAFKDLDYWQMYDNSDLRVASGDYLKLSSMQLRYIVPENLCKRLSVQSAYLAVSGTNLFTLCSKDLVGQDPSQSGTSTLVNISVRPTYSLTLNVTF